MTDTRVGLTEAEVAARRKKYGLNQMRYVSLSSPDFLVPGGEAGVWMPSLPGYLRERGESWSAGREQVLEGSFGLEEAREAARQPWTRCRGSIDLFDAIRRDGLAGLR